MKKAQKKFSTSDETCHKTLIKPFGFVETLKIYSQLYTQKSTLGYGLMHSLTV